MSGWAVPAIDNRDRRDVAPQGMRISTMGYRIGAYVLDGVMLSLLSIIPMIGAIVTGAVSLNQQALDQIDLSPYGYSGYYVGPFDNVTAPLLKVQLGLVAFWVGVYALINAVYFIGWWMRRGATQAPKLLKVRVVDRLSGQNLPF